jgi:hypothetical protein
MNRVTCGRSAFDIRTCATALVARSEMPRRERASRPGLQILLESNGLFLRPKLQRYGDRPRSVIDCMAAGALVVPSEPCAQIIRNPDIVSTGVSIAAEDVHDTFRDAMHAHKRRMDHSTHNFRAKSQTAPTEYAACSMLGAENIGRNCTVVRLRPLRGLRRDSLRLTISSRELAGEEPA